MKRICVKLILLVYVFGLLLIPDSLVGKEKKIVFGFTNVSKALILHPLMAKYKVKEGRFLPEAKGKKNALSQESRINKLRKKRAELIEKKKKLEEQLGNIDKSYGLKLSKLNKKRNMENSPTSSTNQYNEGKRKIENKFWVERRELQSKLSTLNVELASANKENTLLQLTSANETEHVFKLMLDDIYEAIEMVTKHYKIDIVMNSSFTIERTPVNPAFTPINPMADFFNKKFNRDAKEVLFKHGADGTAPFAMTLGYWCASQRWAFRNCIDIRLDKMIIKGGLDMTPAVVDAIYQKYNIHASHRDVIREYFESEKK